VTVFYFSYQATASAQQRQPVLIATKFHLFAHPAATQNRYFPHKNYMNFTV